MEKGQMARLNDLRTKYGQGIEMHFGELLELIRLQVQERVEWERSVFHDGATPAQACQS